MCSAGKGADKKKEELQKIENLEIKVNQTLKIFLFRYVLNMHW